MFKLNNSPPGKALTFVPDSNFSPSSNLLGNYSSSYKKSNFNFSKLHSYAQKNRFQKDKNQNFQNGEFKNQFKINHKFSPNEIHQNEKNGKNSKIDKNIIKNKNLNLNEKNGQFNQETKNKKNKLKQNDKISQNGELKNQNFNDVKNGVINGKFSKNGVKNVVKNDVKIDEKNEVKNGDLNFKNFEKSTKNKNLTKKEKIEKSSKTDQNIKNLIEKPEDIEKNNQKIKKSEILNKNKKNSVNFIEYLEKLDLVLYQLYMSGMVYKVRISKLPIKLKFEQSMKVRHVGKNSEAKKAGVREGHYLRLIEGKTANINVLKNLKNFKLPFILTFSKC